VVSQKLHMLVLNGHQLYFAIDQECHEYTAEDGKSEQVTDSRTE